MSRLPFFQFIILSGIPFVFSACLDRAETSDDEEDDDGYDWEEADTDTDTDTDTDSDSDSDTDTDTDTDSGTDTGDEPGDEFAVDVEWGSDAVDFTVEGGPGGYWLGIAETNTADCGDECWTGEDCVWGYEVGGGSVIGPYCHDLGDGGTTTLSYGGNPSDLQSGTTVFSQGFSDVTTYYLESDPDFGGDGNCWTWGHDTSYYSDLACEEL